MNDNYFMDDLISSLKKDVVMERYYPLIEYKEDLLAILNKAGIVRKKQVSESLIENISEVLGKDVSARFARFIHIYDFNKAKLGDIKDYVGMKEYDDLAGLLRLPGVRALRAKLYFNSGITLEVLVEKTTEDIRTMIGDYIRREKRKEIVPQPKEVNCQREVAKMIIHASEQESREIAVS